MSTNDAAKAAIANLQDQAKAAYSKGVSAFQGLNDLTKGNVEAVVESGKILGSGLKEITDGYVAASSAAMETLSAEIKELSTVKSPADFFKLQTNFLMYNFNAAIALSSQNAETMLKYAKQATVPLTNRVNAVADSAFKAA